MNNPQFQITRVVFLSFVICHLALQGRNPSAKPTVTIGTPALA